MSHLSRPLSLRGRILLLFFALTVLPVSVVSALYYFYPEPYPLDGSQLLAEDLEEHALFLARTLALGRAEAELAAGRAAARLSELDGERGSQATAAALESVLDEVPGWTMAGLLDPDGRALVRVEREGPAATAAPCSDLPMPAPIRLETPLSGQPGEAVRLRVDLSGRALLDAIASEAGPRGPTRLRVVDQTSGATIYSSACTGAAGPERRASIQENAPAPEQAAPADAAIASFEVPGLPWLVQASPVADPALGLLRRDRLVVVAAVLGFTFLAALAFMLILTQVMRSLEEVMGAADKIRKGDLAPWLPPPADDEVGRLSLAFGRMVGALQKAQRDLEEKGRQAMAGELSSMVAHEVRNPLSSIKLNLQGMSRWLAAREDRGESPIMVETCLREVDRLNRVVSSILELGRPREAARRPCSLHDVIEDTVLLLARKIESSGSRVELDLEASIDTILGTPDHLKSVFINLILNALRAMVDEGGGVLGIETRTFRDAEGRYHVVTRVKDTGPGVPPHRREQIFQPFLTERPDGSGIGLPLSRRIATEHGGRLTCEKESELTPGAEFVLRLPLTVEATLPNVPGGPVPEQEDLFQISH